MRTRYSVLAAVLLATTVLPAMAAGPINCRDPWITQAVYQLYRRLPVANSPTTEECDITHYGGGHWNTYGQLVGYIRNRVGHTSIYSSNLSLAPSRQDFMTSVAGSRFNGLPQRNSYGYREVYLNGAWYVIAAGGGNLVSTNGGNLLNMDGAGVIAQGGGNVVGPGGASVIAAGGGNVIAAGGGNVTLYKAKY